jgi:hypothetical protein
MAFLLVSSMAVLYLLPWVWLIVVIWAIRKQIWYAVPIGVLLMCLPLSVYFGIPESDGFFGAGMPLRQHFGAYLVLNLVILSSCPVISWLKRTRSAK